MARLTRQTWIAVPSGSTRGSGWARLAAVLAVRGLPFGDGAVARQGAGAEVVRLDEHVLGGVGAELDVLSDLFLDGAHVVQDDGQRDADAQDGDDTEGDR
jgi:hypothetical protein